MKIKLLATAGLALSAFVFSAFQKDAQTDPWTAKQLMPPAELAAKLKSGVKSNMVVFNIGPAGLIKGAVDIGPTQETGNLARLRQRLAQVPRETEVVIYCGCCPFVHCPNIRPAFTLLRQMNFTNARLLNLSTNLKVDWIAKGYPIQK